MGTRSNSRRAIARSCTSSGPSAIRNVRTWAHIAASGRSSVTPAPPYTWMARSMSSPAMRGAATLIAAISTWAACLPTVSMRWAVFSVGNRIISIRIRASAIQSWMLPRSLSVAPNVTRDSARPHISSSAASSSVLSITISTRQVACKAFAANHFRPVRTSVSPSRSICSSMLVTSELATAGSVIANTDAIEPSSRDSRHLLRRSSLPNSSRISILPVSGQRPPVVGRDRWPRRGRHGRP